MSSPSSTTPPPPPPSTTTPSPSEKEKEKEEQDMDKKVATIDIKALIDFAKMLFPQELLERIERDSKEFEPVMKMVMEELEKRNASTNVAKAIGVALLDQAYGSEVKQDRPFDRIERELNMIFERTKHKLSNVKEEMEKEKDAKNM